ncbi:MAG: 50S ribosomal protein L30 [Candidatus Binataceae bacterium]
MSASGDTVRVKMVRGAAGTTRRVRETLKGLGLGRIGRERTLKRTPAVEGMIRRVAHLVEVLE